MARTNIKPTGLSVDHYCALGMVTANWGALEAMVSSSIWQIGEIPDEIGICLTSQIYTLDGKLKALVTLLSVRGNFENVISKLNKFHEKLRGVSSARNRATHDPWVGDENTGVPHRLQATAEKTLVFEHKPVPTSQLYELARAISEKIDEFDEIIRPAILRFPPLPIHDEFAVII